MRRGAVAPVGFEPGGGAAGERDDAGAGRRGAAARRRAELRTVSVLFVDLVGYTSLSELLDPEDVRDLLGHYFDAARSIVERYGGTIEKFIGDAVMAVWGTPVAREDDAERAVRAALELVDAVAALRHDVGAAELRARAGVVTGQAALLASQEEGVVVGDRVNTAARVQAAAEPGSRARRRCHPTGHLRSPSSTRTPATTSSRARPIRSICGARSRSWRRCPGNPATSSRRASSAATRTCG